MSPPLPVSLLQAGKFNTVPTLINLVAAFTSIGLVGISAPASDDFQKMCLFSFVFLVAVSFRHTFSRLCLQGAVLCDVILLNFLKGAEQYKAKKFEEVMSFFLFFFMIILLHAFTDTNSSLILTKSLNEQIFIVSSIQVSEAQIEATMAQSPGSQLSLKRGMKSSYDSGALSLDTTDQTV